MNNTDAFGLQNIAAEILVIHNHIAVRRFLANAAGHRWVDVEGAFRRRALETRRLIEHRNNDVAPFLKDIDPALEKALISFKRRHRSPLADDRGAGASLGLYHIHGAD